MIDMKKIIVFIMWITFTVLAILASKWIITVILNSDLPDWLKVFLLRS